MTDLVVAALAAPSQLATLRAQLPTDTELVTCNSPFAGMSSAFRSLVADWRRKRSPGESLADCMLDHAKARQAAGCYRRIVLICYSAAYALAEEVLAEGASADRIDGLVWLDSGHSIDGRLDSVAAFAREAAAGRKLFWLRHTDVEPFTFPSTTKVATAIRRSAGGPEPMPAIAELDAEGNPRRVLRSELGGLRIESIDTSKDPTREHASAAIGVGAYHWGDDFAGAAVRALVDGILPPVSTDAPPPSSDKPPPAMTRKGDRGPAAKAWQSYLVDQGEPYASIILDSGGIDGWHLKETERATVLWLADIGLERVDSLPAPPPRTPAPAPAPAPPAGEPLRVVELPDVSFLQARSYQAGRRHGPPLVLMLHAAQLNPHLLGAERLQSWAHRQAPVSWHYANDQNSITASVREGDTAWACPGLNALAIHIEIAVMVPMSRQRWLSEPVRSTLELTCALMADIFRRNPQIPFRRVTAEQLIDPPPRLLVTPGYCDHSAGSKACRLAAERGTKVAPWYRADKGRFSKSTHTDVERGFPWDMVEDCVARHLEAA